MKEKNMKKRISIAMIIVITLAVVLVISASKALAGDIEIKKTWFDNGDLVILVEYWNNTDTTFRVVCLTCTATDDQGELINIGKEYIYSYLEGALVPDFISVYKVKMGLHNEIHAYVECEARESTY